MPDVTENKTIEQSAKALGGTFFDKILDCAMPEPGSLMLSSMSLRYLGKLQSVPTAGSYQRDITT